MLCVTTIVAVNCTIWGDRSLGYLKFNSIFLRVPIGNPNGNPNKPKGNDVQSRLGANICGIQDTTGSFLNDTFIGLNGCTLAFQNGAAFLNKIGPRRGRGTWVHFIGDSDTRGLVLALLRTLDDRLMQARTLQEFASALGCEMSDDLRVLEQVRCTETVDLQNLARITRLDFEFTKDDNMAYKCTHRSMRSAYQSSLFEESKGDVRISYEFQGPEGQFLSALDYWNSNLAKRTSPDVWYLNVGAWYGESNSSHPHVKLVVDSLKQLANQLFSDAKIVYGSSLFHRNNMFDSAVWLELSVERAFQDTMVYFDRTKFGKTIFRELSLTLDNNHIPTIVNIFDAQRLMILLSSLSKFSNYPLRRSNEYYVPIRFTNSCKISERSRDFFISTWTQYCGIEINTSWSPAGQKRPLLSMIFDRDTPG